MMVSSPELFKMPYGTYRGKTLEYIVQQAGDRQYLAWAQDHLWSVRIADAIGEFFRWEAKKIIARDKKV